MFNRTVNIGYKIGVYRTNENTFQVLGREFFDRIEVTDRNLLRRISGYNKTCSHSCNPGTHRLFTESVQYLPCCWTCEPCDANQYSTENDTNSCKTCDSAMMSTKSRTGCVLSPIMYLRPESSVFRIATSFLSLGVLTVIICSVVIYRNRHRPKIKASDPIYLYLILFSLLIGYCTALIPLLKPSPITCTTEYYSFVAFASMISINLLWKCVKVYDIFAAAKKLAAPKLGLLLGRAGQIFVNVLTSTITISILLIDRYSGDGPSWAFKKYQKIRHSSCYLICTSVEEKILVVTMVIPSVSFLITLVLAFKMRQFPHNFRESLSIFCATFVVLLCCVMFLAGYSFSSPVVQPILRMIVIFVASTAFLFCIFIPKMIILFDKELNIEEERESIDAELKLFSRQGRSLD